MSFKEDYPGKRKQKRRQPPSYLKEGLETGFRVVESFRWLTDEFKTVDAGKNTIRIKGVAARTGDLSRNGRRYVEEELKKSARSWVGKPITINHKPDEKVGTVEWCEFEDGALEYLAKINKQPYVNMLRDKSAEIRGVSIEAQYLYSKCSQCGKDFDDLDELGSHMEADHFVKNFEMKPYKIAGNALSLVLSPEEPGIVGTTVELVETAPNQFSRLCETIMKEKKLGEPFADYADHADCVAKNQDKEDPDAYCASIKQKAEEQADVPYKHAEDLPPKEGGCEPGFHRDEAGACVPDEEVPTKEPEAEAPPSVSAEVQKRIKADTVDKKIMRVKDPVVFAALKAMHETWKKAKAEFETILAYADTQAEEMIKHHKTLEQRLAEAERGLTWNDKVKSYAPRETVKQIFETATAISDEKNKLLIKEYEGKFKRLKEALERFDSVEVRLDNLEAALKKTAQFKGRSKPLAETSEDKLGDKLPYGTDG